MTEQSRRIRLSYSKHIREIWVQPFRTNWTRILEMEHAGGQAHKPIYLSIYLWLYRPLLDLDRFFGFLIFLHSRYDSLDGGSARRKAAT
jgi:hypothetical protein